MAIIQTLSSSDFKYQKELAYFLITAGVLLTGLAVKTSGYIEGTKDKKIKPLPEKLANNKKRKYGHWVPEDFKAPQPVPCQDWDINTTKPLPYRPFKHNYFVTMGIRSMDWNNWIELDNEWPKYHQRKLERFEEKYDELVHTDPSAFDAACELLECFRDYLPDRYPTLFKRTDVGMDNLFTGESFNIFERPLKEDPMGMAAKFVQDDLAVLPEGEDGVYYLKAGAIALAGFWRLKDKLNMPMADIHTSGDVPKYQEKLHNGMAKFFIKLRPDKPVVRNNYFIQNDDDIAWSKSIGDEDNVVGWAASDIATDINKIYFRSERQSLRRLPKSGAIVFTIRTYFLPITQIGNEPYVAGRLLDGINHWDGDVRAYKGFDTYGETLVNYLQMKKEEQEKMGYTAETEKEAYPF